MKVLELFAGTRSIGRAFEERGHEVYSVEWNRDFEDIDLYADIGALKAEDILREFGRPDVIWASPDCTSYSVAAISKHRRKNAENGSLDPVSEYAQFCDKVNQNVLKLIRELKPKYYFIENPRGGLRKMEWMQDKPRYTVTYCRYGDTRMKPTDLWTNHPNPGFKPPCKNGDPCHEPAPRGSRTGTQGRKGSKERSRIPSKLCEHVARICEAEQLANRVMEITADRDHYNLDEFIKETGKDVIMSELIEDIEKRNVGYLLYYFKGFDDLSENELELINDLEYLTTCEEVK